MDDQLLAVAETLYARREELKAGSVRNEILDELFFLAFRIADAQLEVDPTFESQDFTDVALYGETSRSYAENNTGTFEDGK